MAIQTKNPIDRLRFTEIDQRRSLDWYRRQIKTIQAKSLTPSAMMNDKDNLVTRLMPGHLYMYFYDPKGKDTLPYYDTFPLVYPFRIVPGGFLGYNLHYLPVQIRISLMHELMQINVSNSPEAKKLLSAYGLLNSQASNKYLMPCIKRYLSTHVQSKFLKIPEEAWVSAAVLPIERFVNASKQKVWKDTLSKV